MLIYCFTNIYLIYYYNIILDDKKLPDLYEIKNGIQQRFKSKNA